MHRHPRPSPVRVSDVDFMQIGEELPLQAPSLSNCFNTGICSWLCNHRCASEGHCTYSPVTAPVPHSHKIHWRRISSEGSWMSGGVINCNMVALLILARMREFGPMS